MSTDQVLTGTALFVVLAVGSQLLAGRLRVPAPGAVAHEAAAPDGRSPVADDLLPGAPGGA